MAAKSKKKSPAKRPAAGKTAAAPQKKNSAAKVDPKALNKEINSILTDEERAGLFIAKHWKKLIAVALIAVVAITAVFAVIKHREAAQQKATAELSNAKTIPELEAAIAKNPKATGIHVARFRLAGLYAKNNEFDKARQTLKEIIDSPDADAAIRGMAQLETASLLELDPKVEAAKAVEAFVAIADSPDANLEIRAEAAYAAGRLYIDLKQPDKANEVLDNALKQLPPQTYLHIRLAELKVFAN